MSDKKDWRQAQNQIFQQDSEQEDDRPEQEPQEGEVVSPSEQGEVASRSQANQASQGQQILYDSSEENEAQLIAEKRKRQMRLKQREQQQQKMACFSEEDIFRKAMLDVESTNKRVMLMRKKNVKRMQDLEKVRMTQQSYLTATNTHFRGSPGEYPLITTDRSGKTLYHPNYSLRINQMRLGDFIQKNIREESSANYLNEVVKFQNYAYQQRKKRRQQIQ